MFSGKYKAIIAGKDREIEMLKEQLEEKKRDLASARDQLDRIYDIVLGVNAHKLKRPLQELNNGLG